MAYLLYHTGEKKYCEKEKWMNINTQGPPNKRNYWIWDISFIYLCIYFCRNQYQETLLNLPVLDFGQGQKLKMDFLVHWVLLGLCSPYPRYLSICLLDMLFLHILFLCLKKKKKNCLKIIQHPNKDFMKIKQQGYLKNKSHPTNFIAFYNVISN